MPVITARIKRRLFSGLICNNTHIFYDAKTEREIVGYDRQVKKYDDNLFIRMIKTEDIPGGVHPRKVRGKTVKVIKPAIKMIHLPVILGHANDIKPTAKDSFDERLISKPCVHKDIFCRDSGGKRIMDHCDGCVRLIHCCGCPGFVPICALVNFRVDLLKTLFLRLVSVSKNTVTFAASVVRKRFQL